METRSVLQVPFHHLNLVLLGGVVKTSYFLVMASSTDLGPGRHGGTPSCFPNSSADDYKLQSLLLIYFSLWLLIFEEQGPACSVGNIASLTCSIVAEPNHGVVCLLLTSAVLNTDSVEKIRIMAYKHVF